MASDKMVRLIDFEICIGCFTCEEVCSFLHDDRPFIKLYEAFPGLKRPISCFHCANAPCVAACPTGAMHRDRDGAVTVDIARCIGCLSCLAACPFGIPELVSPGYVAKCDLCSKLRQQGLEPGCVAMCPARAISFNKSPEVSEGVRKRALSKIFTKLLGPSAVEARA